MRTDGSLRTLHRAEPPPVRPWMRALAWGILTFIGFSISVSVLVWPIGQLEQAGVPHAAALGIWAFTWTVVSGFVALAAARATLGRWPQVGTFAWLTLLIGALVGAAHLWVLADWAIARFGASDPEYVGPVSGLFAVVAGVAVAGFGVRIGPSSSRWPAVLGLAFGVFLAAGIGLQYLPLLLDGVAPSTVAPAIASVAASAYVGVIAAVSAWRLLRPVAR